MSGGRGGGACEEENRAEEHSEPCKVLTSDASRVEPNPSVGNLEAYFEA